MRTPTTRLQPLPFPLPARHPHVTQFDIHQPLSGWRGGVSIEEEVLEFDVPVGEGEGGEMGELCFDEGRGEERVSWVEGIGSREEDVRQRRAGSRTGGSRRS